MCGSRDNARGAPLSREPDQILGAGGVAKVGAVGAGTDDLEGPTQDLRAGGEASCFLKLDISENNKDKVSSKNDYKDQKTDDRSDIPISSKAWTSSKAWVINSPIFLRCPSDESRDQLCSISGRSLIHWHLSRLVLSRRGLGC